VGGGVEREDREGLEEGLNAEGAKVTQRTQRRVAGRPVPSFDPEDEGGGGACAFVLREH
tara:strand:- start:96 stop:272 length:177 start_codon:yes stop_codon:yes gene_type:complete